jgi:hypothetical protein
MPVCMEFENIQSPEWREIRNRVGNSEAVFLLLDANVNRSIYTQNWIAFEIGLACAFNKRVWVLEQDGLSVEFPVPYLTNYMICNLSEKSHFDYVRLILTPYRQPDTLLFKRQIPEGEKIECGKCHAVFGLHTDLKTFNCPSCRSTIELYE